MLQLVMAAVLRQHCQLYIYISARVAVYIMNIQSYGYDYGQSEVRMSR